MNKISAQRVYKIIMLVLLTAAITFMITSIVIYNNIATFLLLKDKKLFYIICQN